MSVNVTRAYPERGSVGPPTHACVPFWAWNGALHTFLEASAKSLPTLPPSRATRPSRLAPLHAPRQRTRACAPAAYSAAFPARPAPAAGRGRSCCIRIQRENQAPRTTARRSPANFVMKAAADPLSPPHRPTAASPPLSCPTVPFPGRRRPFRDGRSFHAPLLPPALASRSPKRATPPTHCGRRGPPIVVRLAAREMHRCKV
eukprot:360783-Chlamydomonas_euryale.AAC.2